jgi:hypothetical protein
MILWLCYDNPPSLYWAIGGLIDGLVGASIFLFWKYRITGSY